MYLHNATMGSFNVPHNTTMASFNVHPTNRQQTIAVQDMDENIALQDVTQVVPGGRSIMLHANGTDLSVNLPADSIGETIGGVVGTSGRGGITGGGGEAPSTISHHHGFIPEFIFETDDESEEDEDEDEDEIDLEEIL